MSNYILIIFVRQFVFRLKYNLDFKQVDTRIIDYLSSFKIMLLTCVNNHIHCIALSAPIQEKVALSGLVKANFIIHQL